AEFIFRKRNEFLVIGWRQNNSALLPVGLRLLNAFPARRNEVPPDEPLTQRFASKQHERRLLPRDQRRLIVFVEDEHLTGRIIPATQFDTSLCHVHRPLRISLR